MSKVYVLQEEIIEDDDDRAMHKILGVYTSSALAIENEVQRRKDLYKNPHAVVKQIMDVTMNDMPAIRYVTEDEIVFDTGCIYIEVVELDKEVES